MTFWSPDESIKSIIHSFWVSFAPHYLLKEIYGSLVVKFSSVHQLAPHFVWIDATNLCRVEETAELGCNSLWVHHYMRLLSHGV